MWNLGLQTRLTSIITLLLLSGFIAINGINYHVSKKALRDGIINNRLPLTSQNIYAEIQKQLMKPIFVASMMASDTFLKDWLAGGEKDAGQITRYLAGIRDTYDLSRAFIASEQSGNHYHYTGSLKRLSGLDPADRWYANFKALGMDYRLSLDTSAAGPASRTITVHHRVSGPDGTFLGAVGVSLKMDDLINMLRSFQNKFGSNIYLVDAAGVVQLHINQELVQRINISSMEGMSRISNQGIDSQAETELFDYERQGKQMLLFVRYVPEFDWYLLVEHDVNTTLSGVKKTFIKNLALGFIISSVVIIINILTVSYFQRRLETMAITDTLTEVYNRRQFDRGFQQAQYLAGRSGAPFSVIIFDIDFFKQINDELGHTAGDKIIKKIADIASEHIRQSDQLIRWGGDEFIILCYCDLHAAVAVAEKIRKAIAGTDWLALCKGSERAVTITCGVALYRPHDTEDTLVARADVALYRAKEGGRNQTASEAG